jgi:ankyrin repeat protein
MLPKLAPGAGNILQYQRLVRRVQFCDLITLTLCRSLVLPTAQRLAAESLLSRMACIKKAPTKEKTTLVPRRAPDLSALLERARDGSSAQAVKAYLDAGGSPAVLIHLHGLDGLLPLTLLHSMAFTNAHPHTELAESVRLLIDADADINAKPIGSERHEYTLLMYAAERACCTRVLDVLLQAGADPCAQARDGRLTALHAAARTGETESCKLLLRRSEPLLELRTASGWTALMYAAHQGWLDVVQLLLQHGADTNAVGSDGRSALAAAVQSNSVAVVQALIDHGADISATNSIGQNVLFHAAREGHVYMLEFLAQRGLSVSAVDNLGRTLLMVAAANEYKPAVEWLLQQGVALDAADRNGRTALRYVSEFSPSDDATMIELLLANGADAHKCTIDGRTVLDGAVDSGNVQCAKALIVAGVDVNHTSSNNCGLTALHTAIMSRHATLVQLLLENGATAVINTVTLVGCSEHCCVGATALMMCTEPDIIELLLAAGADVNVCNDTGNTALHVAARHEFPVRALCLLIKAGADLHAVNSDGKTAAQLAHDNGHTLIEQLLNRAAR